MFKLVKVIQLSKKLAKRGGKEGRVREQLFYIEMNNVLKVKYI